MLIYVVSIAIVWWLLCQQLISSDDLCCISSQWHVMMTAVSIVNVMCDDYCWNNSWHHCTLCLWLTKKWWGSTTTKIIFSWSHAIQTLAQNPPVNHFNETKLYDCEYNFSFLLVSSACFTNLSMKKVVIVLSLVKSMWKSNKISICQVMLFV